MFRPGRLARWILTRRPLLDYSALTVAYVVSGKIALLLAVPPGYASPIFPPSGIAAAAVLIGGRATLPWVFLGAFLLNVVDHGSDETAWAAAAIIAAASMLQAAIGGAA